MKKLFLSSLAINVLVLAFNMGTGIISARYLGPYGRGELAAANRWSGLFIMLFTIGLPGAVIYLGKQNPKLQKEYFGTYIVLGAATGLIGLVCGEIVIPHVLVGQPKAIIHISQVALLTVPFGVLSDGLVGTLQTINQFRRVMFARILSEAGSLVVVVGLLICGIYTARSYIIVNTIWSIMLFALTFYWVQTAVRPRLNIARTLTTNLLVKGFLIYATSLVNVFGGNLDQLAISILLTPYTLGLYAVASSVGYIFPSMVIGALGIYLWPKLMDLELAERNKRVADIHGVLVYGCLLMSLVIMACTHFLLPIMYGNNYAEGIPMAQIMVMGAAMSVGYVVLINYISTLGKFYYTTIAEALGLLSGLGVTIPLLHVMGGFGAAIGLLTTNAVKWIFVVLVCARLGISGSAMFRPNFELITNLVRGVLHRRRPSAGTEGESLA